MSQDKREIVTLTFEAMAHGGEALAREENGRVVFCPYAIAGETARVEIVEARRGFARGRLVELLTASPHRVTPRCPHFELAPPPLTTEHDPVFATGCGGCQWQHIDYTAQLEFKTRIVREQFARVAKLPTAPVLEIIPSARAWRYRNQMRFAVNREGALCLQALESHRLVPIRECHIMAEPLDAMFQTLELAPESFDSVTLRAGENTGERMMVLESDDPTVPELETDEPISIAFHSGDVVVPLVGSEVLTEAVGGRTFEISPTAFFQVNTPMARTLVELVRSFLEPRAEDVLLDAYSGGGLFGISLADKVARVIEVEENPDALEDARANAQGLANIEFHEGTAERILPNLKARFDLAVADPPRAGMERAALDAIASARPRRIAYVSCDPATLARDAARLIAHNYRLVRVQPVDLFPQTYHIECVALFVHELTEQGEPLTMPTAVKAYAYLLRGQGEKSELLVFEQEVPSGVQVPGGTVEPGEALAAAMERELLEEAGISSPDLRWLGMVRREYGNVYELNFFVGHLPNAPETWEHRVGGHGEDVGMTFRYFWLPRAGWGRVLGDLKAGYEFLNAYLGTLG